MVPFAAIIDPLGTRGERGDVLVEEGWVERKLLLEVAQEGFLQNTPANRDRLELGDEFVPAPDPAGFGLRIETISEPLDVLHLDGTSASLIHQQHHTLEGSLPLPFPRVSLLAAEAVADLLHVPHHGVELVVVAIREAGLERVHEVSTRAHLGALVAHLI